MYTVTDWLCLPGSVEQSSSLPVVWFTQQQGKVSEGEDNLKHLCALSSPLQEGNNSESVSRSHEQDDAGTEHSPDTPSSPSSSYLGQ